MIVFLMSLALLASTSWADSDWFPVIVEGPVYPILATQAQLTGTVKLRVVLDEHGKVAVAEIILGAPILARAAQENIKTWAFATCGSATHAKAGPSVEFSYVFRLEGAPQVRPRTRFRYEHPYRVVVVAEPQHWMPTGSTR